MARWELPEEPWQYRLLDLLPSSIDRGQLLEGLKLTPTERIEQVRAMGAFVEEVAKARGDRLR